MTDAHDLFARIDTLSDAKRALLLRLLTARGQEPAKAAVEPIAIVGVGCRFPGGADSPAAFWRLLESGSSGVREVPADRWDVDAYYDPDPDVPGKMSTRWGGFLDDVAGFDARFFGIAPREAARVDPQQRLLLEVAWEALEDAGLAPDRLRKLPVGVFVGISTNDYSQIQIKRGDPAAIDAYFGTGNALSMAAGRLSYVLGLQGPSMSVDTACSSSLVAVHLACQSLRSGESSLALAAGVNVMLLPEITVNFSKARMMARDGRCKTFDARADGYVRGEGGGVVVLKRLSDALASGDDVRAVIRGSAVNHDGRSAGLTVPNGAAQAALIRGALNEAGVLPSDVQYVEAHGSGTPLGDPIELRVLADIFQTGRESAPLAVGSVKTNIGHLEAAAGIAGLIKVVLAFRSGLIPPHLHLRELNPHMSLPARELAIPVEPTPWPATARHVAGVSSFGFAGTNAHLLLESPEHRPAPAGRQRPFEVLTLSAPTETGLCALAAAWGRALLDLSPGDWPDACHTSTAGRAHFAHRLAVVAADVREAATHLADMAPAPTLMRGTGGTAAPPVSFLFTGQGAVFPQMGRALYETQPVFRAALERCDAWLRRHVNLPLIDRIYGTTATQAALTATSCGQPAIFSLQYALAEMWRAWGVTPDSVIGHSVGEFAAAWTAGVLDFEEALGLVAERGRLLEELPAGGAMATVQASEEEVAALLDGTDGGAVIAAVNAPNVLTISGTVATIEQLLEEMSRRRIAARRLEVSHAFHSPLLDPVLDAIEANARRIPGRPPRLRWISSLTGNAFETGRGPDALYWRRQLREPVRFHQAVRTLAAEGRSVLLELGPTTVLASLARRGWPGDDGVFLTSLTRGQDDWRSVLKATAELYVRGVDIDWPQVGDGFTRRRRPMPTYPFERQRLWIENGRPAAPQPAPSVVVPHPLLRRRVPVPGDPHTAAHFEFSLDLGHVPMLAGHRFGGSVVLPAAAFVDIALTAATALLNGRPKRLRHLTIRRLLTLSSEPLELRVYAETASTGEVRVEVRSTDGNEKTPDATAIVERADSQSAPMATDLVALRARCATVITGHDFYSQLRLRGFEFGMPFDAVTEIAIGDGEALGRIELTVDDGGYCVHPALLDACIQVGAAVLPLEWRNSADGGAALPSRIGSVWLDEHLSPPLWSHARLRPGADTDQALVDIALINDAGTCVGELVGLHLVRRSAVMREAAIPAVYVTQWRPCDTAPAVARRPETGSVLVLANDAGVSAALVAGFRAEGRRAVAPPFEAAIPDAPWRNHLRADGWSDVVYAPCGAKIVDACEGLQQVVAGLGAHGASPRLVVVTHRAQAVDTVDGALDPAQTAVWGFTRTLALERPELRPLLVDISGTEAAGAVATLLTDPPDEDELALRGTRLFASRLTRLALPAAESVVSGEGTYIVTGGGGALGSEVAKRLIMLGARNLVLVGRTLRGDQAEHIGASGVRLVAAALDVTRATDLKRLWERLRDEGWPAVRGIVHAAGVLEDRIVGQVDAGVLRRVMAPKIDGACQLAETFADAPLDFFVVFSSAAAALGSPGQAAYAAANAALDGWAHERRRQGRPALSIGWAGWRGLGMAAHASAATPTLDAADALAAFDALLTCEAAHVIVLPAHARATAVAGRRSLLAELRAAELSAPAVPRSSGLPAALQAASPAERHALVLGYVRDKAAAALGLGLDAVDDTQPLTDLGLDSLMAMEVRARLIDDLGVTLPVARLLDEPTVERIVAEVMTRVEEGLASPAPLAGSDVHPDEFPLSRNQMAMWFLQQLAPDSTAYHLGDAVRVDGALDVSALRRAFAALTMRHAALRTTIVTADGNVRQRVHEQPASLGFEHHERFGWEPDQLIETLRSEMERPFDLAHGPLARLVVVSRGPDEHYLLLAMHHIIGELWALILMVQELSRLYKAEARGTPEPVPALHGSYAGFVAHEQRLLSGPDGERLAEYWSRKLTPPAPPLTLPGARPRPAVQTYRGALRAFELTRETGAALKQLAREENTTLFAAMLAAFLVMLRRESGQTDLVVGTPMTGRTRPEWAGIIGYFDNPVPLRVDLGRQPTFRDVVRRVRATVLEAFEHQAYPFPLIVDRARAPRDPARSPLFDAMFVLRKSPVADLQRLTQLAMGRAGALLDLGDGLQAESVDLDRRVSQLDLTLAVTEEAGELFASWEYNADLFDGSAISALTGHFLNLLSGATTRPDEPIDVLPMVTDAERRLAVEEWNATASPFPADRLLHQGFEEQAARTPEAIAVIAEGRRMTYAELDQEAEGVAWWLRRHGVAPNQLVAVVMHKGWQQVVGVLGVLKAGGAYVPIDAHLPRERICHLLERCEVRCALTQHGLLEDFMWPDGIDVLRVQAGVTTDGVERSPAPPGRPEDLAYVIFTSGSTGVPKGVMIDHRGAWNTVYDVNTRFGVGPQDRILALSSLSFDLSVYDVFGTLAAGGAIVLPRAADAQDPAHWAELAQQHGVTVWNSVPALLDLLLQYLDTRPGESPQALRLALLSGDWIPVALPDRARSRCAGLQVIGMGGATEASIWSILYPIGRVDPAWTSIPYGRPMANQTFFVLDAALDPSAVGIPGDLHIGGIGLAVGYWKDEVRTSAAFVRHPRTGERLYRTGDLGRYLPDGTIEFLGRVDAQVKIRGFRVEPGEIEAVLTRAPGVRRVVVTAREDEPGGGRRLVAYVVADAADPPSPDALRRAASETLPDYMVPAAFVFLDNLPLGPNGKVDTRALPAPGSERDGIETPYVAPRNELEERLAALWAQVLRVPRVGVHDDFFTLGGDSIQCIQISMRATQAGLRISPRQIFEDATIAAIATRLRAAMLDETVTSKVPATLPVAPRKSGAYALADFPLARLDERQLNSILTRFQSDES